MVNYKRKIKKGDFSYVTDLVDKRFHTSQPDWAKYAAVLHRLAMKELDYYSSGSSVPVPSKMLNRLEGDCQDQTVLLSSLYVSAGFDVRVLSLEHKNGEKRHVLPEVVIPEDKDKAPGMLRDTYKDLFGFRPGKMAWTNKGWPYFLADPDWSNYVGDRKSLTGEYIREDGSSWEFYNVRYKRTVRSSVSISGSSDASSTASRNRKRSGEQMGFLESLDAFADAVAESL